MPEWLWWFLEPFTKPRYKLTAVDGIKATLFVIICIVIICLIWYLVYELWYEIHRLIRKMKWKKLNKKNKRYGR